MGAERNDIDWFTTTLALGATAVAFPLVLWALDFGRDGGRWWLTVVVLVAIYAVVAGIMVALLRLRRMRAAKDLGTQRPDE